MSVTLACPVLGKDNCYNQTEGQNKETSNSKGEYWAVSHRTNQPSTVESVTMKAAFTRISRIFPNLLQSNFCYCDFGDVICAEHNAFLTLDKSPASTFQPGRDNAAPSSASAVSGPLRMDVKPPQSS